MSLTRALGPPTPPIIIADTGATGHYASTDFIMINTSLSPIINIKQTDNPISVQLPDNHHIKSTHTANLDIPSLPLEATEAHLFPDLGATSLLSIGKLCDAGCEAKFRATDCIITFMGDVILKGTRNHTTTNNLWQIATTKQKETKHSANAISIPGATPKDIILFFHAAFFAPVLSTFIKAIASNFINIPGLTIQALKQHAPNAVATAKGHMRQKRQGIQSTKVEPVLPLLPIDIEQDAFPEQIEAKTHAFFCSVIETTGKTFSDQTGKFIIPSSTGNN